MISETNNLLKTNVENTIFYSLKENNFISDVFKYDNEDYDKELEAREYYKRVGLRDKSQPILISETELDGNNPLPESKNDKNTLAIAIDEYCEKLSYIPNINNSLIYPLGSNLKGYKLSSYLKSDYIQAKGIKSEDDSKNYYEYTSGTYNKCNPQPSVGEDISKYYIKSGYISLTQLESKTNESYGPLINNFSSDNYNIVLPFSYEGMFPSSTENVNLLKFSSDEIDWISHWPETINIKTCNNIYNSEDGLIIEPEYNSNIYFESGELTLNGKYCFSFCSRLDDTNKNENDREYVNEKKSGISSIKVILLEKSNEIFIEKNSYDVYLYTDWNRNYKVFDLGEGVYKIKLLWGDDRYKELPLKICCLSLTQTDYLTGFDNRHQNYKNESVSTKIMPLCLYCQERNNFDFGSNWTICYKRKISSPTNSTSEHIDNIGNIQFGYKLDNETLKPFLKLDSNYIYENNVTIDNFYNHFETVFVRKSNSTIYLDVYSQYGKYNLSGTFNSFDKEFSLPGESLVKINIMLGGQIINDKLNLCYDTYRDLILLQKYLSDTEIKEINNSLMSITIGKKYREYYYDDYEDNEIEVMTNYELNDNLVVLKTGFIKESKRI